jgi:dTDP-glucose 4,6-dehydratase
MRNVLVTGGAGFIGANFVRHLLKNEPNVHVFNLDALTYAGSLENLKDLPDTDRYSFIQGDIKDQALVKDLLRTSLIDTLVHFAAESHVDRSILGPAEFVETNILGTFSLLEATRRVWLIENTLPVETVRFHHISTDEVYGSLAPAEPAFTETSAYIPNSPYAASKAASDHLVRSFGHTYGLPFTLTNSSNNYGPFQFPEKLIPLMILNGIQGKPLPVYGDGLQVRDWVFVEDHCEAIRLVIKQGLPGQTYNIGGNNQPTNLEVVTQVCSILDELLPGSAFRPHSHLIHMVADRPGHDRRYALDISRIGSSLGWQPLHGFQTGLRATVQWYLDHPDWVKTIQSQDKYRNWINSNYSGRI